MCRSLWDLRWAFWVNRFLQISHWCSFSLVWIFKCVFRCEDWMKLLVQTSHLNGRSPVCVRIWIVRLPSRVNCFLQILHLCRFSSVCNTRWMPELMGDNEPLLNDALTTGIRLLWMIYKNEGKQIRNEMILWEKNTKYLIGFSFSELLSSGGSNVPTVGTFRFLRHFNLVASGRLFLFSPRLPEPLVVGNWAELEGPLGSSLASSRELGDEAADGTSGGCPDEADAGLCSGRLSNGPWWGFVVSSWELVGISTASRLRIISRHNLMAAEAERMMGELAL